MNVPLITWITIVTITSLVLIFRSVLILKRHHAIQKAKPISVGREWEEIFVPGDRIIKNDYDYDEFDDM